MDLALYIVMTTQTTYKGDFTMTLNYTPNKNYPLTISKPSQAHVGYYIYEQHEVDPVVSKRFNTSDAAVSWAIKNLPGYIILVD